MIDKRGRTASHRQTVFLEFRQTIDYAARHRFDELFVEADDLRGKLFLPMVPANLPYIYKKIFDDNIVDNQLVRCRRILDVDTESGAIIDQGLQDIHIRGEG